MSKLVSRLGMPMINKWIDPNKKCTICLEFKNRGEFPPSALRRSDYRCTKCSNKRKYTIVKKYPEKFRAIGIKGERKYRLKWYGVTIEWYENKLKEQDYRCAICGNKSDILKKQLDVDHCHYTGKVRGLLCNRCNTGLGQFKDNEKIINNAISYLSLYSSNV
jgi:CRISPR/Cas system-associated protein Cas10 (large subunit of type III CRISPR-Cas system)